MIRSQVVSIVVKIIVSIVVKITPLHPTLQPPTCNHQRERSEPENSTPLIELRHIPLRRMLNGFRDILGIVYGIVHLTDAPSIPPLRPSQINRVPSLSLADKHAVVHYNGIHAPELLNL